MLTKINNAQPIKSDIIIQDLGILNQFWKSNDVGIYKEAVVNLQPNPVTSAYPILTAVIKTIKDVNKSNIVNMKFIIFGKN